MGGLVPQVGHPRALHGCLHPAAHLRLGQAQVDRTEGDIPVHVGGEELVVRILEDNAHPAAQLGHPLHRHAVQQNLPVGRLEHAVQVQKQGGLARPVGPQNARDLSPFGPEVNALQRRRAVLINIAQLSGLNRGLHHPITLLSKYHAAS